MKSFTNFYLSDEAIKALKVIHNNNNNTTTISETLENLIKENAIKKTRLTYTCNTCKNKYNTHDMLSGNLCKNCFKKEME